MSQINLEEMIATARAHRKTSKLVRRRSTSLEEHQLTSSLLKTANRQIERCFGDELIGGTLELQTKLVPRDTEPTLFQKVELRLGRADDDQLIITAEVLILFLGDSPEFVVTQDGQCFSPEKNNFLTNTYDINEAVKLFIVNCVEAYKL